MNNKGFTLIELIVTIVILAIVMSFGAYSIINIIKSTQETNYKSLIKNVNSAVSTYATECTYSKASLTNILANDSAFCTKGTKTDQGISLGELVTYGYLSGNDKDTNKNYTIVNPKDNKSIADCKVRYKNNNGKITVYPIANADNSSCPTSYTV